MTAAPRRTAFTLIELIYDATNGTVSFGNIYRTGGAAEPADNFFAAAAQGR
jgi:hypothetical protein